MAWSKVQIEIDGQEIQAMTTLSAKTTIFSFPALVEVSAGDSITVGKKTFLVQKAVDLADRGETLLVEAKESKDDKRTKRRSDPEDGGASDIGEDDS